MKSTQWLALVVAAIIVLNLRSADAANKPPRSKPAKKPAPAAVERGDNVVKGYGETAEKARDRALEQAQKRVEELLARRLEGWAPTAEQLDPDYLVRFNVVQAQGEPGPVEVGGEKAVEALYRVELTPEYMQEIVRTARLEKVEQRHLLLARVLAGILAVVLVTAGYLRLEESTNGYATKLLRLVAVIVLAVVGVGLLVVG